MSDVQKNINNLLKRRTAACLKLDKALAHKSRLELIEIITAWMDIKSVEDLADFQDRHN